MTFSSSFLFLTKPLLTVEMGAGWTSARTEFEAVFPKADDKCQAELLMEKRGGNRQQTVPLMVLTLQPSRSVDP